MYFNKLLDSTDYEIASYVKKYLLENSKYTIKLHVGCDSQNISSHTNYATTWICSTYWWNISIKLVRRHQKLELKI